MKSKKNRDVPEPIRALRLRLETWRRNRNGQRRIPEEFWTAAVELARQHGVSFVSGNLALDYIRLKQKVNGNWGPVKKKQTVKANFVEIAPPPISLPSLVSPNEIELSRSDGHRIIIRNADGECVRGLAEAFFSK